MKKPVLLVICDGLGLSKTKKYNAWSKASTPNFDNLLENYPNSVLKASGESVGLPANQIGNSEVGHLTIGAGRIVYTGLPLINKAIANKSFYKNKELLNAIKIANNKNQAIHIMGLLSDGGVHSDQKHLFEILKMLYINNVKNVYLHAFGDGRDVAPKSIITSLTITNKLLKKYGFKWGSISGRYYAMDRDENFERSIMAYKAINNKSQVFSNVIKYVKEQYMQNITDEFFIPASYIENPGIKKNDVVIFFNFRPDRSRQLSHLMIGSNLFSFPPADKNKNIYLISLMKYPKISTHVAFPDMTVKNPIGKILENNNLKQLRIAETEKYAHVTFFMDGGKEINFKNENKIIVLSKKVASFDLMPKMSAKEITDELIKNLKKYDVCICNYANADMVGHTGIMPAAIKAMNELDIQIGRLLDYFLKNDGVMFLTADHGNIEVMKNSLTGLPSTKHTTNLVPFICTDKSINLKNGMLFNVSPTILEYMNIKKPIEMTGNSLIKK